MQPFRKKVRNNGVKKLSASPPIQAVALLGSCCSDAIRAKAEKGNNMKKRFIAGLLLVVLVVGFCPSLAFAAGGGGLQGAVPELSTQAGTGFDQCTVRWTGAGFAGKNTDQYQFFYVKGKNAVAVPTFDLYLGGVKIDPSKYTVVYKLTWWDDAAGKDQSKEVAASGLTPSGSPNAGNDDMSSEYQLVITAKAGSGYSGSYTEATVVVVDWYNVGRTMAYYMTKASSAWKYGINPMNRNYFVIPQAKAKATLSSLKLMAGCTPGNRGMNHDGTTVASKYYSVTYYKANKNAVKKNLSPATRAKTGKALKSAPTAAGAYVMVIKGKSPYYGNASILFDIQGSMSSVKVAKVAKQKYTGKAVNPKLKVTYKGTTLKQGVDYTVTYKNNKKVGTATATIKGAKVKSNTNGKIVTVNKARFFTGSMKVKFKIAR